VSNCSPKRASRPYSALPDAALYAASTALCTLLWFAAGRMPDDAPALLLWPVSRLAGLWADARFVLTLGVGYEAISRAGLPVRITAACSGARFTLMLTLLLILTQMPRLRGGWAEKALSVGLAFMMAWTAGVLATAARIASAMRMAPIVPLDPVLLHNMLGIATYLAVLLLCNSLTARCVDRWNRRPLSDRKCTDHVYLKPGGDRIHESQR
jgi:exosortase K